MQALALVPGVGPETRVLDVGCVTGEEPDAQKLADQVQREIAIWQAYSELYSYEFFVVRSDG